jgi:hypothetical protein
MTRRPFIFTILSLASTAILSAQQVEEPPIPVMIVCPYHEDSLRRAYESDFAMDGNPQRHQLDSVSLRAIRAATDMSAQMERSFTFLYLLLAILALTSIAALRVAYRLRSELQDLRRSQHVPTLSLPAPVVVDSSPLRSPSRKNSRPKPTQRPSKVNRSSGRPRSRR